LLFCCYHALPQSRNLDYYLGNAFKNSPALHEFGNLILNSQAEGELAKADMAKPKVYTTADYLLSPSYKNFGYDPAITNGGLYSALVNFSYPLLTKVYVEAALEKIKNGKSINENKQKKEIHELNKSIPDQYIKCFQDITQIQYYVEVINLLKDQQLLLKRLALNGIYKATDYKLVEIELQNQLISQHKLENLYLADLADLNILCGIKDTANVKLETPAILIKDSVTGTSQFLIGFKLDSLDMELDQRQFELKYKPQLSFLSNAGLNSADISEIQRRFGYSAGLSFSLNLYDGNQKKLKRQMLAVSQNTNMAYRDNFTTRLFLNKSKLKTELQSNGDQIRLLQNQIKEYELLIDMFKKELATGQISIIEFVTALRNYIDLKNTLIVAQGDQLLLVNEYNYWNW